MFKRVHLSVAAGVPGWLAAAGAAAGEGPRFFRAVSSANTELGRPAGNTVPVRTEITAGTATPFRLEWTPALGGPEAWATIALAAASNLFLDFDYRLPRPEPARGVWSNSFGETTWTQAWQVLADKDWGWSNLARVAVPGERFETCLRAGYPSNSCSPASAADYGTPQGGGQFLATAGLAPTNSLHLRSYVRFPADFNFVKGGKRPGTLRRHHLFSGGALPDGTHGFTVRSMWRAAGDLAVDERARRKVRTTRRIKARRP